MRTFILAAACLLAVGCANSGNVREGWNSVLKKCVGDDLIKDRYLFFGASNDVGPGSVWRYADDKSLRLLYDLTDPFPDPSFRATLISQSVPSECIGDSATEWRAATDLPFNAPTFLGKAYGELSSAKSIAVSVKGVGVDLLKETKWKEAYGLLGKESVYVTELRNEGRLIASNAVKVYGLEIVFAFEDALSLDVQAQFTGKNYTIGMPPTASMASGAAMPSSTTSSPIATDIASQTSYCARQGFSPVGPTAPDVPGGASFVAKVINEKSVALCTDGPVYLLAAYSTFEDGALGLGPIGQQALVPFTLDRDARVE